MEAGHPVMSPRIMVQPWGAGADICPQLGSGLWYKWCECGSRWESGMRISQTSSEDSRAIGVCSCLHPTQGCLPKVMRFSISRVSLWLLSVASALVWCPWWVMCAICAFAAQGPSAETFLLCCETMGVLDLHTCSWVLSLCWQIWLQIWAESSFPVNESWWKFVSRVCKWDSVVLLLILHLPVIST